ncbi:MAG: ATP-binding cassette domain-containing protein [Myxococcota bacterium]
MTESASSPTPAPPGTEHAIAATAHALERVATAAGSPVSADAARRAVARCHTRNTVGTDAAVAAAAELGLTVRRARVETGIQLQPPALALLDDGRWLIVAGRGGHRFHVVFVSARGTSEGTLTAARIQELLATGEWLHFEPMLPLETVSTQTRPELAGRPWKRLRSFLNLERSQLGVIAIYAIVIGLLSIATPVAAQAVVNSVAFGTALQPLVVLSILLFFGLAFAGALRTFEAYVVEVLQRRIFVRVADDFGRRLAAVPDEVHDEIDSPELVNRFFDVVTIQKSLSTLLLDGLSLTLQTLVGMILLGFYHPLLLAFDLVLLLLLLVVFALGRGATKSAKEESSAKYRVVAWLEDIARAPKLFAASSSRDHAWNRADLLARDYLTARKNHFRVLLRQIGGGIVLRVVAIVALLGVGGYLVIERQLTLGQLVAAELVVTAMGAAFAKLGKNLEKLYDLNVGVAKVGQVLDLPIERQGGERLVSGEPLTIAAGKLKVSRGGATLLNEVAFEIDRRERVLLDGDSASGKSTLLSVLSGDRSADLGGVQYDGLDLRRADLSSIRNFVVTVASPTFVAGSVMDNLFLGGVPLPEPDTRRLLQMVEMEDAVDVLPKALDQAMLPNGAPFSERQQRRLALVRGLAHQPRALFLDRALDGLGLSDEAFSRLLDMIFEPSAPWTLIVVSEDPEVRRRCTRHFRIHDRRLETVS